MHSQTYQQVKQSPLDGPDDDLPDYSDASNNTRTRWSSRHPVWRPATILFILLGISVIGNLLLVAKIWILQRPEDISSIASLEWNTVKPLTDDDHRGVDDSMWDTPEYPANFWGYVALDHKSAQAAGLRPSQNWPWDESKGIYVMQGFHSMHCLTVLRDAIRQFRDGNEQTWPAGHVSHCLHDLREDIICRADDTPLYTGVFRTKGSQPEYLPPGTLPENRTEYEYSPGHGQPRMCRNWDQLRRFAREHSACYSRPLDRYAPILERYKNCPDGRRPWLGSDSSDRQERSKIVT